MSTIPINLPDNLRSYVEEHAKHGGYTSAGEYIVALIAAASEKRSAIEGALVSGLSSGPVERWTRAEWQAIKDRVAADGSE